MSDFSNMTAPPAAPEGAATPEQKTMSMLSHLLGIFTGVIGPLVIWLINKDKPNVEFVVDQSKESLNFQITVLIASFAAGVLTMVLIGFILLPAIILGNLILCIMAAMKANEGVAYRYPFALRLIK